MEIQKLTDISREFVEEYINNIECIVRSTYTIIKEKDMLVNIN